MKKLKINYLLIGAVTLLLAVALWPSIPWFGQAENRVAAIQSRGVLRISTINSPLTWTNVGGTTLGLDYELAKRFADYLGVRLDVTVRDNVSQVFDDLDHGRADILAAGLVYNSDRRENYRAGPTFYSVSQQLVYKVGNPRPKSMADVQSGGLVVAPGLAVLSELETMKKSTFPNLSWSVDPKSGSFALLQQVVEGNISWTISDSIAIGIFQRIHPQLAVALDVTDEQPVSWLMAKDGDDSLSAVMLDFFSQTNEDGTLARLEEKYLGHVGEFDYVDTRTFLSAVDNTLPDLQPLFEKYATDFDWRLLAAIAYQESHWDRQATSPTGVRGIMMLTRNTAQSLGVVDRTNAEESISGGARYLQELMNRVPDTIPKGERIWFALAAYNMGYAHMLDARTLTLRQKGNPNSWTDVKARLPLLSQKNYYSKLTYGYARGHEAYAYVENIRKYQISLVGYLMEKEKKAARFAEYAQAYPAVTPEEIPHSHNEPLALNAFFPDVDSGKSHLAMPHRLVLAPHQ